MNNASTDLVEWMNLLLNAQLLVFSFSRYFCGSRSKPKKTWQTNYLLNESYLMLFMNVINVHISWFVLVIRFRSYITTHSSNKDWIRAIYNLE